MLRRLLIITGIVMVGIASFILLNKPLIFATVDATKEEQEPLVTKEEELQLSISKKITEKLHEKYVGVDVRTTSKKELTIRVVGNEEYFNSVKKDMESIAKSVIQSSPPLPIKDHTVVFEKWDLFKIPEEFNKPHKEFHLLAKTLMEGLKDYEVVGNIGTNFQKSITIHTSIKGSEKDLHKLTMEIETAVNEILHSKELISISNIDSYDIKILNFKGKVVN